MDAARRLFVALFPPPPVQMAIDAHRSDWEWPPGVRLTRPARIHLTLHFLGDVDEGCVAEAVAALSAVQMVPFELSLTTPQVWRHNGVAVLRPDPHEGLDALHRAIVDALAHRGLARPGERWAPHLTIARRAQQATAPEAMAPIGWTAREFVLVCSRLTPPVFRYDILARYPAHPPHGGATT